MPSASWLRCILFFACLVLAPVLRAQLAYEAFNYGDETLAGTNGGTGFAGAWTTVSGSYSLVANNLSVNGLTTDGVSISGTGENTRTLSSSLGGNGNTVWFSAVIKISGATNSGSDFAGVYFGGAGGAMFMGASNNGSKIGIVSATNASLSNGLDLSTAVSYTANTSYLLVMRFDFTSGTGGNYFFYFNPSNSTDPGTPTHGSGGGKAFTMSATNLIGVYSGNMTLAVDEIRLGSTYASVVPGLAAVPEPGSWSALAGALVLGLGLSRKRRRTALPGS